MNITFTVPGRPQGKARARVGKSGAFYTPESTVQYQRLVALMFHARKPRGFQMMTGPVGAHIVARFSIPKSRKDVREGQYYCGKPDGDNIAKAILDALNGIAWKDDTHVAYHQVRKIYADVDDVIVTIEQMEG